MRDYSILKELLRGRLTGSVVYDPETRAHIPHNTHDKLCADAADAIDALEARLQARQTELLEANNRLLERARVAESALDRERAARRPVRVY